MGVPGRDFEFSDEPFHGGTGPDGRVLGGDTTETRCRSTRELAGMRCDEGRLGRAPR